MSENAYVHIPVMLNEVIENLCIKENGIYIDGTLGGGGHTKEILKRLSPAGQLIGIDQDIESISFVKESLKNYKNITYVNDNHDNIKDILQNLNIDKVDGILLDLGVSSYQIDSETRGFTYRYDSPLDMRMNQSSSLSATDVVNTYSEEALSKIFFEYGEEKFSRRIATNIIKERELNKISTTFELKEIILKSLPAFSKREPHPEKRVFQALRIEVNNELKPLHKTVLDCVNLLKPKGRLCVITFHSLEDRIVKSAMNSLVNRCTCPKDLPYCVCGNTPLGKILTKKPIIASENELSINSRSKSAKLRVFEKI